MPPKPGNAFAQQKELQRLEELETKHREENVPDTPTTTMSMFIGPDVPHIQSEGLSKLNIPPNLDPLQNSTAGRCRLGQRAFTDPLVPTTAHSAGATDSSSFDKQSNGLGHVKSKFNSKSNKYKDSELSSQPLTNPAPSQHLSDVSNLRNEALKGPCQPLPSHLSFAPAQKVATPPSRYVSLLKNDAMILGNISMTPTRSGSYAMAGRPDVIGVSHPSIASMAGTILEASPPDSGTMADPEMSLASSAQPDSYDASYTGPLPPPQVYEFQRMNQKILTLNDKICAMQRYLSNQLAQANRKMDLLLKAQGIDTSSRGQVTGQDRDFIQEESEEEVRRRQDDTIDPTTSIKKEVAPGGTGTAFGTSSPPSKISNPRVKTRKPTPYLIKGPIMAAALTSTPPHVPQLPTSQTVSSSVATVTITDPSVPSPSAVSNARRVRNEHTGARGDTGKENRRTGNLAKGLMDATRIPGPGSHVHPALRYQEGIEGLAEAKENQQATEKKKQQEQDNDDDDKKILWRRPSGDGEIGGRWYKAAMAQ